MWMFTYSSYWHLRYYRSHASELQLVIRRQWNRLTFRIHVAHLCTPKACTLSFSDTHSVVWVAFIVHVNISINNILGIIKETHAEQWSRQAMGTRAALSSVWEAVVEEGIVLWSQGWQQIGRSEIPAAGYFNSDPTKIQLNFNHRLTPSPFFTSPRKIEMLLKCRYSLSFHTGFKLY